MVDYERDWETSAVRFITDDKDVMECPACGEIALAPIGVIETEIAFVRRGITEYSCEECGHYETGN